MTPLRHDRNISALLPVLCIVRLKVTAVAAVRSTHKRKRNPAPTACASALHCGQNGRLGNDLFPLLLPVSPSVSGQQYLCQISQLPREVINQTLHTSNLCEIASQKAEGIFQCSLASYSPFNQLLSLGRKRK